MWIAHIFSAHPKQISCSLFISTFVINRVSPDELWTCLFLVVRCRPVKSQSTKSTRAHWQWFAEAVREMAASGEKGFYFVDGCCQARL